MKEVDCRKPPDRRGRTGYRAPVPSAEHLLAFLLAGVVLVAVPAERAVHRRTRARARPPRRADQRRRQHHRRRADRPRRRARDRGRRRGVGRRVRRAQARRRGLPRVPGRADLAAPRRPRRRAGWRRCPAEPARLLAGRGRRRDEPEGARAVRRPAAAVHRPRRGQPGDADARARAAVHADRRDARQRVGARGGRGPRLVRDLTRPPAPGRWRGRADDDRAGGDPRPHRAPG